MSDTRTPREVFEATPQTQVVNTINQKIQSHLPSHHLYSPARGSRLQNLSTRIFFSCDFSFQYYTIPDADGRQRVARWRLTMLSIVKCPSINHNRKIITVSRRESRYFIGRLVCVQRSNKNDYENEEKYGRFY